MSIHFISDLIRQVSQEEILPRFQNLERHEITAKSPGDMVSIADTEAEKALSRQLMKRYPSAIVGGEESIAEKPQLLAEVIAAEQGFLIDPVDGTNNFIKGDEKFALMLARLHRGVVVAAWIYLPVADKMAMAERGGGALLGGAPFKIRPATFDPEKMIAAAHINRFPAPLKKIARENLVSFHKNRPAFCAGYDYIALMEGKKDFSIYYRTLPWDHLPGTFIFSAAGGYVRNLTDGAEYTIHDQRKGLLSATSEGHWRRLRDLIFPGYF